MFRLLPLVGSSARLVFVACRRSVGEDGCSVCGYLRYLGGSFGRRVCGRGMSGTSVLRMHARGEFGSVSVRVVVSSRCYSCLRRCWVWEEGRVRLTMVGGYRLGDGMLIDGFGAVGGIVRSVNRGG